MQYLLEALVLLATLAYLDMSLVSLYLAGVLTLSNPLALILAGLFFVAGPGSWAATLTVRPRASTLLRTLLPVGMLAVVYSAVLTTVLYKSLAVYGARLRLAVLPAVLAVALVGVLEISVHDEAREILYKLYESSTGGLPPYATLIIVALSILNAMLVNNVAVTAVLVTYAIAIYKYTRCTHATRRTAHLAAGLAASALAYGVGVLAGLNGPRTILAGLLAALPHVTPLLKRVEGGKGRLCTLYPITGLALAALAEAIVRGPVIDPIILGQAFTLYALLGLIGWSSILLVALAARRLGPLAARVIASREMRVASGLALVLVASEAIGVRSTMLAVILLAAGFATATINNALAAEVRIAERVESKSG